MEGVEHIKEPLGKTAAGSVPACVAGEEQQRQKRPHVLDGVGVELPVDLEDMVVKQSENGWISRESTPMSSMTTMQ